MARIVVVDDEPDVRDMLADYLGGAGHVVQAAADAAGLDRLLAEGGAPDAVVLDVGLPGRDGFTLARELRAAHGGIGILMLTGLGDTVDRVVGLEVGADDYLAKPVALPELAARIGAVLRRRVPAETVVAGTPFGPYRLDLRAFCLRDAEGREVALSPMEVDLVAAFATNPGRTLTRDDLMRLAPPRDGESSDRSIDHRVNRLRRKLEAETGLSLIRTVRSVGYVHLAG